MTINTKGLVYKIKTDFIKCYEKYVVCAEVTSQVREIVGKCKKAYVIRGNFSSKEVAKSYLNCNNDFEAIYIIFDESHKVLIESSEWLTFMKL